VGRSLQEAKAEALSKGVENPLFHGVRRKEFQGMYLIG
jgi:hypothetical protein